MQEKAPREAVRVEPGMRIHDSCWNRLPHCILTFILHPTSTLRALECGCLNVLERLA